MATRPRNPDLAATKAGPLRADPAPGAQPLPKDSERVVAGPGVAFTGRMWRGVWAGGLAGLGAGAAIGAVVGLIWAAVSSASTAVVFGSSIAGCAVAGGTVAFVLAGMRGAALDADPESRRDDAHLGHGI